MKEIKRKPHIYSNVKNDTITAAEMPRSHRISRRSHQHQSGGSQRSKTNCFPWQTMKFYQGAYGLSPGFRTVRKFRSAGSSRDSSTPLHRDREAISRHASAFMNFKPSCLMIFNRSDEGWSKSVSKAGEIAAIDGDCYGGKVTYAAKHGKASQ